MKRSVTKKKVTPRLNLNTATFDELVNLPGVGKKLATAIIAARPYATVRDLVLLDGVSAKLYAKLLPLIKVSAPRKKKIVVEPSLVIETSSDVIAPIQNQVEPPPAIEASTDFIEPLQPQIEQPLPHIEASADIVEPIQSQAEIHLQTDAQSEIIIAPLTPSGVVEPEPVAPVVESVQPESTESIPPLPEKPVVSPVQFIQTDAQQETHSTPPSSKFIPPAVTAREAASPKSTPAPIVKPKITPPKTGSIRYVQTPQKRSVATVAYVLLAVIAVIFISAILIVTASNRGSVASAALTPSSVATIVPPSSTPALVTAPDPTQIVATDFVPTSTALPTVAPATPTLALKLTVSPTVNISPTTAKVITPTIGATPTATALASLPPFTTPVGVGASIFTETFDPRKFYWGVANTNFSKSEIRDGQLVIRVNRNAVAYVFAGVLDTQDFYYQATTRVGACAQTDQYGLQARASDDRNFYFFGVTCEGGALAHSVVDGSYTIIGTTPPKPFINKGEGAINVLALRAVGKELQFFVNGEQVYSLTNTDHRRGKFGVFALAAWVPALSVTYDDIAAWKPAP